VVGASGYAGAELVSLLAGHPEVGSLELYADGSAGRRFGELHPRLRHVHDGVLEPFVPDRLAGSDAVFLALPHGEAARAAEALLGTVGLIVDLSGDLRLPDAATYRGWYGRPHPAAGLLGKAVYGLPELFGSDLAGAELVACAGCYATLVQIAAAPALLLGAAPEGEVTVSACSGTSGAGRRAEVGLGFSEVHGDLRAYRVGRHQHVPEIVRGLERRAGRPVRVTFVPHLAPLERGIAAAVVLRRPAGLAAGDLRAASRDAYADAPFVRVVDPDGRYPGVKDVAGTNYCDLTPVIDEAGGTVVVIGVIDNLVKGAAGQAVQVLNRVRGFEETAGLEPVAAVGRIS